jgi:hypothetical protein
MMSDREFNQLEVMLRELDRTLQQAHTQEEGDEAELMLDMIEQKLDRLGDQLCKRLRDLEPWGPRDDNENALAVCEHRESQNFADADREKGLSQCLSYGPRRTGANRGAHQIDVRSCGPLRRHCSRPIRSHAA